MPRLTVAVDQVCVPHNDQFTPGMVHYYIDEREVTKEEADAFAVAQGLT